MVDHDDRCRPLTVPWRTHASYRARDRLFLLSPLIAEFLLGDLPITGLYALVGLAPLYGGGALLIREVCRRAGWGWPSILTLALAYSVLE